MDGRRIELPERVEPVQPRPPAFVPERGAEWCATQPGEHRRALVVVEVENVGEARLP